jgi:hypothetical protein
MLPPAYFDEFLVVGYWWLEEKKQKVRRTHLPGFRLLEIDQSDAAFYASVWLFFLPEATIAIGIYFGYLLLSIMSFFVAAITIMNATP